jgi:hypothetical protein
MSNVLQPTKQKLLKKRMFGFDIETYNDNKNFYCVSIYGEYVWKGHNKTYAKVFYDKNEFIHELKTNHIFRNSILYATNLSFDFFGMFFNTDESENFTTLFRGSDLLHAKTYIKDNDFYPFPKNQDTKSNRCLPSILFLDSMNYCKLSVAKMGEVIGLPKIERPSFIGKLPTTPEEIKIMEDYNLKDSEITFKFMKFLNKAFEDLGATVKNTIASTSKTLFTNKYLQEKYFRHDEETLLEIFKAYYGGRTEALERGYIQNYNYYDFNSLYPSVMFKEKYPNPNTLRVTQANTNEYINDYEGVSEVNIFIPHDTTYPLLPVRHDEKVLFPTGHIRGSYTHVELREAMKQGAVLTRVHKTYYYLETCTPFKEYIGDLYALRNRYKAEGSPLEIIVKLFMNSLYGKFGQKFIDKDNFIHQNAITKEDLDRYSHFDRIGDYFRVTANRTRPANFCIPIWACYVTAYGRIKLQKAMQECNPVYVDTDSLITKKELPCSRELGDLKLEMTIKEGVIVRPKFYGLLKDDDSGYIKIKGLGVRLNYLEFWGALSNPCIEYTKFTKFKEALRRELIPNQIIKTHKEFSLEDSKRKWEKEFNMYEQQKSTPLCINTV